MSITSVTCKTTTSGQLAYTQKKTDTSGWLTVSGVPALVFMDFLPNDFCLLKILDNPTDYR